MEGCTRLVVSLTWTVGFVELLDGAVYCKVCSVFMCLLSVPLSLTCLL